jgi:hypothetical protein
MYPQVPWELIADRLGFAEHTLGTAALRSLEDNIKMTNYRESYRS